MNTKGLTLEYLAEVIETAGFNIVKKGQWVPGILRPHNYIIAIKNEEIVSVKLTNIDDIIKRHKDIINLNIFKINN